MNFSDHTKLRKEKFGTVVFDTLTEKIFITDPIGSDILELIKQGKDLTQVLDALADSYDAEKELIEKDIVAFIDELKASKIICEKVKE